MRSQHLCKSYGLCALLILAGCATPYQPTAFSGGYSEAMLAPDTVRIIFRGNGCTSPARASDFALLRAAEFTLEHGYRYFAILENAETIERVETEMLPATTHTHGSGQIQGNLYNNRYQGQISYSETTTHTPATTVTFSKPVNGILIRCFEAKPDNLSAFDAAPLAESLRARYGMEPLSIQVPTPASPANKVNGSIQQDPEINPEEEGTLNTQKSHTLEDLERKAGLR